MKIMFQFSEFSPTTVNRVQICSSCSKKPSMLMLLHSTAIHQLVPQKTDPAGIHCCVLQQPLKIESFFCPEKRC